MYKMYKMRPISDGRQEITANGEIVAVVRDDLADEVFEFLQLLQAAAYKKRKARPGRVTAH